MIGHIEFNTETQEAIWHAPEGFHFEYDAGIARLVKSPLAPEKPTYTTWRPKEGERCLQLWAVKMKYPTKELAAKEQLWVDANLRCRELARMMNEGKVAGRYAFTIYHDTCDAAVYDGDGPSMPDAGVTYFYSRTDCTRAIEILRSEGLLGHLFEAP